MGNEQKKSLLDSKQKGDIQYQTGLLFKIKNKSYENIYIDSIELTGYQDVTKFHLFTCEGEYKDKMYNAKDWTLILTGKIGK